MAEAPWGDGAPVHIAWFEGVRLDDVRRWLTACFPGRLTALATCAGPRFSLERLELEASQSAGGVRVLLPGHDEGFLHELALAARREAHSTLVVDGVSFDCATAWLALSEYAPGEPCRTIWFDRVRALPTDLEAASRWLSRYANITDGLEAFALRLGPWGDPDAERWLLREDDVLLEAPRRLPSFAERARQTPRGVKVFIDAVTLLVALFLLGPLALALPVLVLSAFSAALGAGSAAVAGAAVVCGAGGALVSLLPLAWPNGTPMSRRARALLFVTPQVVMPAVWAWRSG
ncbi:MAG: hypothetical protein JNJ54_32845 [Myxococcaceae bacterium]|nr:hypothetical protein [Myxococcaceae bacterium]